MQALIFLQKGKIMKYIFFNIKELLKQEKVIFIVVLICIFLSSFALNFTYGLSYNYTMEKANADDNLKHVSSYINQESAPTHKQVQNFVESLSDDTLSNLRFYFSGSVDEYNDEAWNCLESRFTYKNGEYGQAEIIAQSYRENIKEGTPITNEDEKNGNLVAVVNCDITNRGEHRNETTLKLTDENGYLNLFGNKYKIIGADSISTVPTVPFLTIPDDFVYDDVAIISSDVVFTRAQYDEIQMAADINMPGAITFPELELPDTDAIKMYNNIIVIAILLSVLSVLNFSVLFDFILKKQNHTTAILRLCGCSKLKAILVNIGECILISVPVYFIGTLFYTIILKTSLKKLFSFIADAYSFKIYMMIFATYFVILLVIMSIVITKHLSEKIIDEWKEGRI